MFFNYLAISLCNIVLNFMGFTFSRLFIFNWGNTCFTMLCMSLPYNTWNELYIYIPSLWNLPPTSPVSPQLGLTEHLDELPVLCGSFPLTIPFLLP